MYWLNKEKLITLFAVLVISMLISGNLMAKDFVIEQKDKTFVKDGKPVEKLSVKVGDKIDFLNQDPWFHNIFSLSDIKTFDLGSYPQGESKSVVFNTAGEAEIECAIHPQMYMVLDVK